MGSRTSSIQPDARFGVGRTVAVIGGGFSGVSAAAHLLKRGLVVTLFERSSVLGGVWHYDDRVAVDPPYPNNKPSLGDYTVSAAGEHPNGVATPPQESSKIGDDEQSPASTLEQDSGPNTLPYDPEVAFSPPGPCYAGLKTNVPTQLMVSSLAPWPEGTERSVGQQRVEEYIHRLARDHGVDGVALLRTRVDQVRKSPAGKWEIRTLTLEKGSGRLVEKLWYFDLVVVASGHYNMPRIPDIPGLKEWKAGFPSRVIHSKQYRNPAGYQGQNVLIIGGGVSSVDICREVCEVASNTYQSVRGGSFDLPPSMLPPSTSRVGEVVEFSLHSDHPQAGSDSTAGSDPIPGRAILSDGKVLDNIHRVVIATGYITSYPYLPQFHDDAAQINSSGDELIVTSDGIMAHNLHKDIFYIKDPTLAFVGVPYHAATFSLFDFQAQALSWVFAGKAHLPTEEDMRKEYQEKVAVKGHGREFHSLHAPPGEIGYVKALVEWVNGEVGDGDDPLMTTHSKQWVEEHEKLKATFAGIWKKE